MEKLSQTQTLLSNEDSDNEDGFDNPASSGVENLIDKVQGFFDKNQNVRVSTSITDLMQRSIVGHIARESYASRGHKDDLESTPHEECKLQTTHLDAQFLLFWNILVNNMGFPRGKVNNFLIRNFDRIGGDINRAVELFLQESDKLEEEKTQNTEIMQEQNLTRQNNDSVYSNLADNIGRVFQDLY
jgi:hypothetical protein